MWGSTEAFNGFWIYSFPTWRELEYAKLPSGSVPPLWLSEQEGRL